MRPTTASTPPKRLSTWLPAHRRRAVSDAEPSSLRPGIRRHPGVASPWAVWTLGPSGGLGRQVVARHGARDPVALDRPRHRLVGDGGVHPPGVELALRWPRRPRRARAATGRDHAARSRSWSAATAVPGPSTHASWARWSGSGNRAICIRVSGGSWRRTRRVRSSICCEAPKRQHRSIERKNGEWRPERVPRPSWVAVRARSRSKPSGWSSRPLHQAPEQPGGARAQQPEPELLDVGGADVVTDGIDDGIGPRLDGEGGDGIGGWGRHGASSTLAAGEPGE